MPYASRTAPTGSLLLSILQMFHAQADHFGDRTGPLANV